jgi:hypothetical protein
VAQVGDLAIADRGHPQQLEREAHEDGPFEQMAEREQLA